MTEMAGKVLGDAFRGLCLVIGVLAGIIGVLLVVILWLVLR